MSYRLRFGRFIDFITTVIKDDRFTTLTERAFRKQWEQTEGASERTRFKEVLRLLNGNDRPEPELNLEPQPEPNPQPQATLPTSKQAHRGRKPGSPPDKLQRAYDAYDLLKSRGVTITEGGVAKLANVAVGTANKAIALRKQAEEAAARDSAKPADEPPKTWKEWAEREVAKRLRLLELEFEERVRKAADKLVEDLVLPHWAEKVTRAERILARDNGTFTKGQFRKILFCLHPDQIQDPERKPRYEEAFRLVQGAEDTLVKPDPKPVRGPAVPRTTADLLKMRKQPKSRR